MSRQNALIARKRYAQRVKITELRDSINDLLPLELWPTSYLTRMFVKLHHTNKDRFIMLAFFMVNGINPELLKDWYKIADYMDQSAWNQLDYLIKNWI